MRLFICEFITGGGLYSTAIPDGLAKEGNMMLNAVATDFLKAGITDIVTTRDEKLGELPMSIEVVSINNNPETQWESCMLNSDAVLFIAPETNHVLYQLTHMAEKLNVPVLGCNSESIKLTSSKLKTAELLKNNKLPFIETMPLADGGIPKSEKGWILKPDDGVGGEGVYLCQTKDEVIERKNDINAENYVIQPYVEGVSASISMLCHQGKACLLGCNKQEFYFNDGKGLLKNILVNGLKEYWLLFQELADKVASIKPGLSHYIGVDVLLQDKELIIVEINPRITTSYAGLEQSLSLNPAEMMLSLIKDKPQYHVDVANIKPIKLELV